MARAVVKCPKCRTENSPESKFCRMHDLHEEGQTLFITMEYVRGEDLKSLARRTG
jgi:hypothetical protein